MAKALVLVADGARARGFVVVESETPRAPFAMIERFDLVNPQRAAKDFHEFRDSTPVGNSPGGTFLQGHGFDDHRAANDLQHRKGFAQDIARDLATTADESKPRKVIVVAAHSIRSLLERALEKGPLKNAPVHWVTGEFSHLSVQQLQHELHSRQLVP